MKKSRLQPQLCQKGIRCETSTSPAQVSSATMTEEKILPVERRQYFRKLPQRSKRPRDVESLQSAGSSVDVPQVEIVPPAPEPRHDRPVGTGVSDQRGFPGPSGPRNSKSDIITRLEIQGRIVLREGLLRLLRGSVSKIERRHDILVRLQRQAVKDKRGQRYRGRQAGLVQAGRKPRRLLEQNARCADTDLFAPSPLASLTQPLFFCPLQAKSPGRTRAVREAPPETPGPHNGNCPWPRSLPGGTAVHRPRV